MFACCLCIKPNNLQCTRIDTNFQHTICVYGHAYTFTLCLFIYNSVFRLDLTSSTAPSSVVSRLTRNLIRSSSLLSDHSEEVDLPAPVQQWLDQYSSWCNDWKIKSLDVLLARYVSYCSCIGM